MSAFVWNIDWFALLTRHFSLFPPQTHMDDAGLQKMMSRFEMMPKLEYLELHHNKISDAVAKVCMLCANVCERSCANQ